MEEDVSMIFALCLTRKIGPNGNVESKIFERKINYRISTVPRKNSVLARFSCEASVRWQNFLVIYVTLGREDRTKEVFNVHTRDHHVAGSS